MSPLEESPTTTATKEAVIEFLGVDDYREFWKVVKEDLHASDFSSRITDNNLH
jgi:hypothetical protein